MSRWWDRVGPWGLAAVALAFATAQALLGPRRFDFGWDETVYLSQVTPHVPAAMFTAPRARGVTVLVGPIAVFSTSVQAVRVYLIVVSALGLMFAFRVWLKLVDARTVVLAAGLFAALWQTQVYGNEVYPNFWIALLAVATVGWAARTNDNAPRARWFAALSLCAITVLRPGDAGWVWLALLVAPRWEESWRTLRGTATLGLAVGLVPWLIEAQVRFGGVPQRIAKSSAVEGGLFPHLGFLYEARALNGPLLCRPCTHAYHPLIDDVWWLLLPMLVACGVVLTRRLPDFKALALAGGVAAAAAAPYLLLVGYSAPRFLLPAYALAVLPTAAGLLRLGSCLASKGARRMVLQAMLVLLTIAFIASQAEMTTAITHGSEADRRDGYRTAAAAIHKLGVTRPCLIAGYEAPPIAYEAGCSSDGGILQPANANDPVHQALAIGESVIVIAPGTTGLAWTRQWNHSTLQLEASRLTLYWPAETRSVSRQGTAPHRWARAVGQTGICVALLQGGRAAGAHRCGRWPCSLADAARAPVVRPHAQRCHLHIRAGVGRVQDAAATGIDADMVNVRPRPAAEEHEIAFAQVVAAHRGPDTRLVGCVTRQHDTERAKHAIGKAGTVDA